MCDKPAAFSKFVAPSWQRWNERRYFCKFDLTFPVFWKKLIGWLKMAKDRLAYPLSSLALVLAAQWACKRLLWSPNEIFLIVATKLFRICKMSMVIPSFSTICHIFIDLMAVMHLLANIVQGQALFIKARSPVLYRAVSTTTLLHLSLFLSSVTSLSFQHYPCSNAFSSTSFFLFNISFRLVFGDFLHRVHSFSRQIYNIWCSAQFAWVFHLSTRCDDCLTAAGFCRN